MAVCGRGTWTRLSTPVLDAGLLFMGKKRTYPSLVLRKLVACLFDWGGSFSGVGCWVGRLIDGE